MTTPVKGNKVARFSTQNDLPIKVREQMITLLNQELADAFDLLSQTKQAHWNVKGMNFIALHKLFDELADGLEDHVDEIAERVTSLGGYATGTARMAAASSRLPEFPTELVGDREFVQALVERYAQFGAGLRAGMETADEAGDQDTMDLLTEVSREADKSLWFLEAHLQD
jgi:starvation-inducible DNA-binding protein